MTDETRPYKRRRRAGRSAGGMTIPILCGHRVYWNGVMIFDRSERVGHRCGPDQCWAVSGAMIIGYGIPA